ncbi:MAG: putative RNA uridine N3 methyltransferase [Acidilobaceae archaeon]
MGCFVWPPPKRRLKLSVGVPGSVLGVEETLQLKAVKAGWIGRTLAAFRVDECIVYKDPDTSPRDARLLVLYLRYMLTPPHLRKKVIPLTGELRASGVLPPLNTYNHLAPEEPKEGDVLEVFVEECSRETCRAYLGKPGYGVLRGRHEPGSIVVARVVSSTGGRYELEKASWGDIYTGFRIRAFKDVVQVVNYLRKKGTLVVLASKYGRCLFEQADALKKAITDRGRVGVVFGGPYRCPYEYSDRSLYDFIINTVPRQGTMTVRTEEALLATLSAMANSGVLQD